MFKRVHIIIKSVWPIVYGLNIAAHKCYAEWLAALHHGLPAKYLQEFEGDSVDFIKEMLVLLGYRTLDCALFGF